MNFIKRIFELFFPVCKEISGEYVADLVNRWTYMGWRGKPIMWSGEATERWRQIRLIPHFVLKSIELPNCIASKRLLNRQAIVRYAETKSDFPPIVVGMEGVLLDGLHRIHAARLRAQKMMQAYVPLGYEGAYVF